MNDSSPPDRPQPLWRRALSLVGSVFLGGVLLLAAVSKSLDPAAFAEEVRSQGLDLVLSAESVALVALALEFLLGSALLLAIRRRVVLWPTAALVAFFVFLTGRTWYRAAHGLLPEAPGCGCFGNLVQRSPAEAFWQDLLLMVPALALAFLAVESRTRPTLRWALVLLVTVGGTVFAWKAPELPLDEVATRLKPGVEITDLCAGAPDGGTQTCMNAILHETEGRHLIVLTELKNPTFLDGIESLNEYVWQDGVPPLWVLSSAGEEESFQFRFTQGAAFEVLEAPEPMLRPLYRTLPRSFLVEDGTVVETWSGLPPLDTLAASSPTPESPNSED